MNLICRDKCKTIFNFLNHINTLKYIGYDMYNLH
jgi:hypothetical protein